jgi:hypothetical protein
MGCATSCRLSACPCGLDSRSGLVPTWELRGLAIENGGRGLALNVRGEVHVEAPEGTYDREILAGSIAAGDLFDARISPYPGVQHWGTARGILRYSDLVGGSYETPFTGSLGSGNELVITAAEQSHTTAAESASQSAGSTNSTGS